MTCDDIGAIRAVLRRNTWLMGMSIVAPSGEAMEQELFVTEWGVGITSVPQSEWDLYDAPPAHVRGDVALVCNTMLCSQDPARWLANLAEAADYAIVQDLSRAARARYRITDPATGDHMRFSVSTHGVIGRVDDGEPFDLAGCGATVLDCERYFDDGKFVVLLDLRPLRRRDSIMTGSYFGAALAWLAEHVAPAAEWLPALA